MPRITHALPLLAAALSCCADAEFTAPADVVVIDNRVDFTAVQAAADAWSERAPGSIRVVMRGAKLEAHRCGVIYVEMFEPGECGGYMGYTRWSECEATMQICGDIKVEDQHVYKTVMHELGHALLSDPGHSDDPADIMYRSIGPKSVDIMDITDEEAQRVLERMHSR